WRDGGDRLLRPPVHLVRHRPRAGGGYARRPRLLAGGPRVRRCRGGPLRAGSQARRRTQSGTGTDSRDAQGGRGVGQSADQIRREIEEVRSELGQTIDAIGDRVSPRRAVHRRTQRMRSGLTSVREAIMGKADEVGSSVTDAAGNVRDGAASAADSVSDKASSAAQVVADSASSAAETVGHAARRAPGAVSEQTRGNPLAAGVVAFGVGMLAAAAFPATKVESRLADTVTNELEPLKDKAQQVVQQVGEDLTESARTAADHVQQRARQAGEDVAQHAQAAAQRVQDEAAGASGAVTDQAQTAAERVREEATNSNDASRQELYERAQQLDIPGRSQMTKDELAEAVRQRSN